MLILLETFGLSILKDKDKMSKHHVKIHTWQNGQLSTNSQEFDNLEAAQAYAGRAHRRHNNTVYETQTEQVVKIYEGDQLVSTTSSSAADPAYA